METLSKKASAAKSSSAGVIFAAAQPTSIPSMKIPQQIPLSPDITDSKELILVDGWKRVASIAAAMDASSARRGRHATVPPEC
jgi:hypothetical protein